MDTSTTIPVQDLKHLHMDPEQPVPSHGDGMLLREFDAEAVDAMVSIAGINARSPLLSVEVRHLGGAISDARRGNGALPKIDAKFAVFAVGLTPTPESRTAVECHVAAVKRAIEAWDAGRAYLNFTTSLSGGNTIWGAETYARLGRVKAKWDPFDLFRSNHPVSPAQPRRHEATRPTPRVSGLSRIAPRRTSAPPRRSERP
jgi:hypothetical protein